MATIYWKLGHLSPEGFQRPLDGFVVFRDGLVFDVDSVGWDRGIRPGDSLAEMKWRHPGASWVPWQEAFYQKLLTVLQEWLRQHAAAFEQRDVRQGWWEWPRLTEGEWHRLIDEIVPRWAQRIEAGIASHPWMAHWAADEGGSLKAAEWKGSHGKTYVLGASQEEMLWPKLPLRYVEGILPKVWQGWHKRRWERVEDVPGLLSQIRQLGSGGGVGRVSPEDRANMILTRRFDEALSQGIGELMRSLGQDLYAHCHQQNQGVRFLRVTWVMGASLERREREWPKAAGDAPSMIARVLSLLSHPPSRPIDQVQLEARMEPMVNPQMVWWELSRPKRPDPPPVAGLLRFSPSRRELLLQHWDLWRVAGGRE